MSTKRYASAPPYRKDETGRPLCRWCGKPVPKGRRRTWCSQECVNEYLLRSNRCDHLVEQRDHGICAICGLDCLEVESALDDLRQKSDSPHMAFRIFKMQLGLMNRVRCWDADHVVPVCRGGGECGLENYRTLCCWCHRKETGRLAAERAAERRAAKLSGTGLTRTPNKG